MKRAPSRPLNYKKCLWDIIAGYYGPRTLSATNARIIASFCDYDVLGKLNGAELGNVLRWMCSLKNREVSREILRKFLSHPEELFYAFDALVCLVAAPMLCPSLLVDGKNMLLDPRSNAKNAVPVPADAIADFALKALRGFEVVLTSLGFSLWEQGETRDHLLEKYPKNLVSVVRADSVLGLKLMLDVLMEPMPIALILSEGGPECRRLLLRPETYEGCEVGREALAALAVIALDGDAALSILQALESDTPGFIRTIKDDAGHNLLWYLGFRNHISMETFSTPWTSSPQRKVTTDDLRDYLLEKARCNPEARDAFDLSWKDVRGRLGL